MVDRGTDGRLDYLIGLSFYVPTEIHEENRLEFSDAETDPLGMPKATVRFTRSRRDIDLIGQGTVAHGIAADRLGQFDLLGESVLRPPGSSLHITGTVRMGSEDDGSSVCDNDMRLWEYRNLFVAGCGAIPTAMACNATLTGTVTAVRAARAAAKLLNSLPLREAAGSPK
jgi:choline dehydrogenase-like flavoprotein